MAKTYKVMLPLKNHTTKVTVGDATHTLEFSEVSGHLEAQTTDEVIVAAMKDTAIIEEVQ